MKEKGKVVKITICAVCGKTTIYTDCLCDKCKQKKIEKEKMEK